MRTKKQYLFYLFLTCLHYLCKTFAITIIMGFIDTKSFFSALTAAIILLSVAACSSKENDGDGPHFTINGTVSNADGKVLYFANESLGGTIILDSVKLDNEGKFQFRQPKPETFEFYIVGFRNGIPALIAVDSTETITLVANAQDFAEYTIENSPESDKIKEMSELTKALEKQIAGMKPDASFLANKATLLKEFKENTAKQYIVPAPYTASAYFTLWLTLKDEPIFKPLSDRFDSKCYAAVATSMKMKFPDAKRTKHLCSIAEEGMKATRPVNMQDVEQLESMASTASTSDIFEINLPNRDGDSIRLSSLKGKVVLLDFTLYEYSKLKMRNIDIRELHDRYNKNGFEIYQVSFDSREHFWQQEALGLPWTCVRDGRGSESPYLARFNVQTIPTYYLINRNGEIVMRDMQIEDISKEIDRLIKE